MRITLILFFIISLSACSNSSDVVERPENKSDNKSAETTLDQVDNDINKLNPNLIRQQTETSFRSIKSQDKRNIKPLTTPTPGYGEAEKK